MTLDQHMYGSTDWHLPSPSSTPKSVTFPESSLKTPKTEAFPQTHFIDAWATPQINGQHTPAQTPSFTLSTPIDRPSSSYSLKPHTPEDPEFHVNHFVPNNLPLPPVEVSRRLSSSPDPSLVRRAGVGPGASQFGRPRPVTMDFSHMQTPPPTRDANSRRRLQQSGGNDFATPATVIHRTPNQMPTAEGLFNQTPFGFTNVPFSPSMMPFSNTAPMSAPPMPQSRLFWDQPNDGSHMDVDMGMSVDPFGPTPHKVEQNFDWQSFSTPARPQMNSMTFQSPHHGMSSPGPATSFASSMGGPSFSQSNSFVPNSASVDPNMLFSFSGPDMTASFGQMPQQTMQDALSRQPYETQAREAQQEKETAKKARSLHSRSNTNSSSGSIENARPGLQRSNTDSGIRKNKASLNESRALVAAGATIPRRSSPLKRQGGAGALGSIPEIRRPRTRLIIDETGRARTETIPIEDNGDTPRAVPRASQKDVRRQYPGLWDEDDTESDDEDEAPAVLSRNASFNIPQPQQQRRTSKHARSDSGALALERSNSFKMPRPASRTSSAAFDQASFETVRPVRNAAHNAYRSSSMMELHSTSEGIKESEDQQMPDSPGDALGALKKVVAGRQQRAERASQNTLKAHNQRWAQASADMVNIVPPHSQYDPFSNSFQASPLTDAIATPSTGRSSISSESTRCVCNGMDDGKPMIQCESCNKWLHMICCGLNGGNLPPVYVCVFCTGQTPVARGGRIRGPAVFDSPLTHKSMYRR
ncbi:hypothetical protein HBH98_163680 [Parastagonospora nodorum]|nr:hypothetical protein HBH52_183930 [Parastagonospora nodorum]KAH3994535.1 hypothetical protein HBI10_183570 [Parastagonospora nodorum]KAH4014063.1 hypothetical protein HBI13_175670 [Parastagonospora nodorum]KAH4073748.1 hypothetical protein HBH50_037760 [Parastagonospora nodorum]KAH4091259.1 hypothetical protein HBH48_090080 [Parastagonospora nodorum]